MEVFVSTLLEKLFLGKTLVIHPQCVIIFGGVSSGKSSFSTEFLKQNPNYVYLSVKDISSKIAGRVPDLHDKSLEIIHYAIFQAASKKINILIELDSEISGVERGIYIYRNIFESLVNYSYYLVGILMECTRETSTLRSKVDMGVSGMKRYYSREVFKNFRSMFDRWCIYNSDQGFLLLNSSSGKDEFGSVISNMYK